MCSLSRKVKILFLKASWHIFMKKQNAFWKVVFTLGKNQIDGVLRKKTLFFGGSDYF